MILFTPKDGSKESFNKLLAKRTGGLDNLSHKAIYDVAYELYCSLACVTDKKEALKIMLEATTDELKGLRLEIIDLKERIEELVDEKIELSKQLLELRIDNATDEGSEEMEKLLQGD